MRIAVVDDERPARSELKYLILQCLPEAEIREAADTESFMKLLDETEFDACFVDIDLAGANGTTLVSMIRNCQPQAQIVFATAYGEYAVRAFELGAADYLLKPFDLERVRKTADRLASRLREEHPVPERLEHLVRDAADPVMTDKLMVVTVTGFRVLDVSEIIYIETENRGCRVHSMAGSYLQNESLSFYESRLHGHRFFRVHKSFLVNLEYVSEMVPFHNGGYALRVRGAENTLIPIGRTQLREFRNLFGG